MPLFFLFFSFFSAHSLGYASQKEPYTNPYPESVQVRQLCFGLKRSALRIWVVEPLRTVHLFEPKASLNSLGATEQI